MKLRTKRAIQMQYNKVQKAVLKVAPDHQERDHLYGALQALAWALDDMAMAPIKAFNTKKRQS